MDSKTVTEVAAKSHAGTISFPDGVAQLLEASRSATSPFCAESVTYLGRQGDQHVEWFPGAGPSPD